MAPKTKNISTHLRIHDSTQFEFNGRYQFRSSDRKTWNKNNINLDFYFFMPPNSYVADSLSHIDFYKDILTRLRLAEPNVSFREILGKGERAAPVIGRIRSLLTDDDEVPDVKKLGFDIRLFGCMFYQYFWRRITRMEKKLSKTNLSDPTEMTALIDASQKLWKRSHKIWNLWIKISESESPEHGSEEYTKRLSQAKLVDELITTNLLDGLSKVGVLLHRLTETCNPTAKLQIDDVVQELRLGLLTQLYERCEEEQFVHLGRTSSFSDMETYLNRKRSLKGFVFNVLYLKEETPLKNKAKKYFGPMIAAALAASFAITAHVAIFIYTSISGIDNLTKNLGVNGFLAAMAIVIAYVLKDRIKDIGKTSLSEGKVSSAVRSRRHLFANHTNGSWVNIGAVSDSIKTLSTQELNPQQTEIWKQHRHEIFSLGKRDPIVINFQRCIKLKTNGLKKVESGTIHAIGDLIRFKVSRFLPSLDTHEQDWTQLTPDGQINNFALPKYYYIDVLLFTDDGENPSQTFYRVTLSKRGVEKIQKVYSNDQEISTPHDDTANLVSENTTTDNGSMTI